jgi:hypothetical protein
MKRPKSQSYIIGFSATIALFVFLNIVSFLNESISSSERERVLSSKGISFSAGGYSFGFPFKMYFRQMGYLNHLGFEIVPTLLNIAVAVGSGLVFGLILQLILTRRWTNESEK